MDVHLEGKTHDGIMDMCLYWCIWVDSGKPFILVKLLTISETSPGFYVSAVQVLRKHCRKRKNCS